MRPNNHESISFQNALDNLSCIAAMDVEAARLGVVRNQLFVAEVEAEGVEWFEAEGSEPLLEVLDRTYQAVHHHLVRVSEGGGDEKAKRGVAALMSLVGEATEKMDAFLTLSLGKVGSVEQRESFKELQQFYTQRFEGELPLEKGSPIDFEAVQRDTEYELFYIRSEEGEPYFTPELLRNIRLSCHFETQEGELEEDPLLRVRAMQDRDLHASAGQVLGECHAPISDFYKMVRKLEGNELAESLGMAIHALFLAANPRYLLQNTVAKSCLQYYEDFHRFLRRAMRTSEYQKLIAYPPDRSDKASLLLLYLTHALCKAFFERVGGVKLESIGLIHRIMRRGVEVKQARKEPVLKGSTIWNQFLIEDEKYRTFLAKFPNGPLFKVLDLIQEEQDAGVALPFDPLSQGGFPCRIYDVQRKGKRIEVLRLPAPIRQELIHKVEIDDEFRGFLRGLEKEQKHLLINLQDRTSWKEYARCKALETLQIQAEFSHLLVVLTLPKKTDFYFQAQEYASLEKSAAFLAAFRAQLAAPEECGYFFSPSFKLGDFTDKALAFIHHQFFANQKELSRQDRQIFIEIFYQLLILKWIDLVGPTSLSFTCKDGIDTGAAEQGIFYGFLQLLTGDFSQREEQDFLRWLFYTPALLVRERAMEIERFHRAIATLEWIDLKLTERGKEIVKALEELYPSQMFKTLGVKHL